MWMTQDEIKSRYLRMNPGVDRIRILAQLNGCRMCDIKEVVGQMPKRALDLDEVYALYISGALDKEIARRVERSEAWVALWRRQRGYKSNSASTDFEVVKRAYEAGKTDLEIGMMVNRTSNCIGTWRRRNGLPVNKRNWR